MADFKRQIINELEGRLSEMREDALARQNEWSVAQRKWIGDQMNEIRDKLDLSLNREIPIHEKAMEAWSQLTDVVSALSGLSRQQVLEAGAEMAAVAEMLNAYDALVNNEN